MIDDCRLLIVDVMETLHRPKVMQASDWEIRYIGCIAFIGRKGA